jgi:HPr kinase/phosphorylase
MKNKLTSDEFVQAQGEKLGLHWEAGQSGGNRLLKKDQSDTGSTLAGYLNLVRPNRIQVIGPEEVRYLEQLGKNSHQDAITRLFKSKPAMIIFAGIKNSSEIDQTFLDKANETSTPLLSSIHPSSKLIELLQYHLARLLSDSQIMHGVFMEVMGIGVLLTGPSGIGKSELALELLSRGHRLVADDAPEFRRSGPDTIHGRCPFLLKDFIEVRGLGILNVRAMFGDNAIVEKKRLRLIVLLESITENTVWEVDRLGHSLRTKSILEVDIPEVHVPVAPGRNVAVIIEAAVRNHVLYLNGYNAAEDFIKRQQKLLQSE